MMELDLKAIAEKWQKRWEEKGIFKAKERKGKKKYYVLEMYPYPSASFLHMGHVRNYTIGDVYARFKRMQGYNVLYPMGYDSFGLPAETAAKKEGIHPRLYTEKAIKKIMEYQKALGNSYDWSRVISSHEPDYYKWNQYFFLKLFEKGLAYRKKAPVNWCGKCESVLANEEAEGGKCWRCGGEVGKKEMEQWFFKITAYADRLLEDLEKIDWPEKIKTMQRNWIGRSYGTEIDFEVERKDNISNVVIIHGSNSSEKKAKEGKLENERHWKPWLKKELEKRGIEVSNNLYPEDWLPDYDKWKKVFEKNKIDENSILVGHSAGTAFLLRWLSENKRKINKLILIAPSIVKTEKYERLSKLKDFNYDSSLKDYFNQIILIYSDNDAKNIIESVKQINSKLGGELIEFKNHGHFTLEDMGTEEFPELLDKIVSNQIWPIFTTRPDTVYGVTFMVISAQHPRLMGITTPENKEKMEEFVRKCQKARTQEEIESLEKEGVFTGSYATNPLTGEKVPVWAGNFVVAEYGSGMVMAVPSHDQRDFEFAKKYKIPIRIVIQPKDKKLDEKSMREAYTEEGILVNSEKFSGIESKKAIEEITQFLERKNLGRKTIQYKIKDWMISRQRYWGTPIPIIYCEKCGVVPVPEKELPVLLPEKVDFQAKINPLLSNKEFVEVKCPKCKGKARRETDTMGGFVDSSWYFLRYCDPRNKKKPFEAGKAEYWMPVDQYVGGAEHAVMHLIYARFFVKALKELGFVKFEEPFKRLFNQGILLGPDGEKMSKSKGNVVFQTDISEKYGIDTARFFLMMVASPDKQMAWSEEGVEGAFRALNKVWRLLEKQKTGGKEKKEKKEISKVQRTIKKVTEEIEEFKYNNALIDLMELVNYLSAKEEVSKESLEAVAKLLCPFAPHLAEEIWESIGEKGFVSLAKWPKYDEKKIDEKAEVGEEAVQKLREDIRAILERRGGKPGRIRLFVADSWKYSFVSEMKKILRETRNLGEIMKKVMVGERKKYGKEISSLVPMLVKDPGKMPSGELEQKNEIEALKENKKKLEEEFGCAVEIVVGSSEEKARKAMPGKAGIWVE